MCNCRICGNNNNNRTYIVKEMMFGTRLEFEYFQCSNCNCLQIKNIPENLSQYYPEGYYSYNLTKDSILTKFIKKHRTNFIINKTDLIGLLLQIIKGHSYYSYWFKETKVNYNSAILDVGCGSGSLLNSMAEMGFKKLTGADPFIEKEINYTNGVHILKKDIFNINTSFDLIMLHHSFEHMPDQLPVLKKISDLLNPGGYALIRIPIVSKLWEKYGIHWYTLDAPRHIYLHSFKSMELLAKQAGLKLAKSVCDSVVGRMIFSEQYKMDIPYNDPRSYDKNRNLFSQEQIKEFSREINRLNKLNQSDCAAFYLQKI